MKLIFEVMYFCDCHKVAVTLVLIKTCQTLFFEHFVNVLGYEAIFEVMLK